MIQRTPINSSTLGLSNKTSNDARGVENQSKQYMLTIALVILLSPDLVLVFVCLKYPSEYCRILTLLERSIEAGLNRIGIGY